MEKQVLFGILNELSNEEFETFKWFLKDRSFLKNFPAIPNTKLTETKLPIHLVDVMVQTYVKNAIEVTRMTLKVINRQDLLEQLPESMPEPAGASRLNPAVAECGPHRMDTGRVDRSGSQMSKPGLKKYFYEMILDINSAHRFLKLSHNNRKAECASEVIQPYPDHPDRFDIWCQVLCSTALTSRCYWEVEWSGEVQIAVTYRGINRKGGSHDCVVGENPQSWSLWCSADGHSVRHNKIKSILPHSSLSSGRIAVDLDYSAGSLSFYKVSSGDLIHLHTYNTTFTEPLYAGFWFGPRSSVSLCDV
ncbi:neoverrucotoxin subunit beta-like [Sphaeramia orbicularis]|uniref:Neoverrucotoxin subunit beta-like n=1 Tax=Sphaeramia orbicularis TaxID=375764 RepID=A0A673AE83_9TELE|nr:neoverrucotoxin subunit beta-like [Sphaeramia orbicularis]